MANIFLSYARANLAEAQKLAARLRAAGFTLWFDEDLPAHRTFSEVIEEQLGAAKAVVVIWSAESAASQWVRSEANRGRETGRLVQVRVDDARLRGRARLPVATDFGFAAARCSTGAASFAARIMLRTFDLFTRAARSASPCRCDRP